MTSEGRPQLSCKQFAYNLRTLALSPDIRALWRSGLSARVLECQKLKM